MIGEVIYLAMYSRSEDVIPVRKKISGYDAAIIVTCRGADIFSIRTPSRVINTGIHSLLEMNIVESDYARLITKLSVPFS